MYAEPMWGPADMSGPVRNGPGVLARPIDQKLLAAYRHGQNPRVIGVGQVGRAEAAQATQVGAVRVELHGLVEATRTAGGPDHRGGVCHVVAVQVTINRRGAAVPRHQLDGARHGNRQFAIDEAAGRVASQRRHGSAE